MYFKFKKSEFKIYGLDNHRYKKRYFDNKYTLIFLGKFRTPIEEIENIILNFKNKNFDEKNLEQLFRKITGICTIIVLHENEIKIAASILHPCIKIFEEENEIIFTDNEFNKIKKLSADNSFLKLFSHHSYFFHHGISKDVKDFLIAGSVITINKKNVNDYNFSWYFDFEEFCSRDDHEKIASDLTDSYLNNFKNLDTSKEYFLSLSGGMDSALLLGAGLNSVDLQPIHMGRGIYSDELSTAEKVSKFFNKKLHTLYAYGLKYSVIGIETDITKILEYNFNFVKNNDSLFFPLHNGDITLDQYLPSGSHLFNGDGDPLLLTIDQHLQYPDRIKKDFDHNVFKDKRFFYSKNFYEKQIKKDNFDDEFDICSKFPDINPYYYPIINSYVDQLSKLYDYRKRYLNNDKSIPTQSASPISDLNAHQLFLFKECRKKNAFLVLNKIMKSTFFNKNLRTRDALVAQKLLKFFKFLGAAGKDIHQSSLLSNSSKMQEAIALNSNIVLQQMSTIIDDKLVNFSKWHSFKVFKNIIGKDFIELMSRPSLKNPKYTFQRLHSRIDSKISNLPEHNDHYALINNKSLNRFLKSKKIVEKYNDFKADHDHKNLLYEMPSENDRSIKNNTNSNFWKMNNIINIVSKIE